MKFYIVTYFFGADLVASFAEAWIEIVYLGGSVQGDVASFAEAWIEINGK